MRIVFGSSGDSVSRASVASVWRLADGHVERRGTPASAAGPRRRPCASRQTGLGIFLLSPVARAGMSCATRLLIRSNPAEPARASCPRRPPRRPPLRGAVCAGRPAPSAARSSVAAASIICGKRSTTERDLRVHPHRLDDDVVTGAGQRAARARCSSPPPRCRDLVHHHVAGRRVGDGLVPSSIGSRR